ncbi:MAG: hypothetical protein K0U98_24800 [Deltaproteobacteria bacterium]|nr:hypothetical protein [Deltaproteobacteria bacterium]
MRRNNLGNGDLLLLETELELAGCWVELQRWGPARDLLQKVVSGLQSSPPSPQSSALGESAQRLLGRIPSMESWRQQEWVLLVAEEAWELDLEGRIVPLGLP